VPKANHTVPLQTSNHSSLANSAASLMDSGNSTIHLMDVDAGRVLREQTQRVKCPRCGRGSRVFISEAAKNGDMALSQTLPIGCNNSTFLSSGGPPLRLSRLPYSDWAKAEAKYILINYFICLESLNDLRSDHKTVR